MIVDYHQYYTNTITLVLVLYPNTPRRAHPWYLGWICVQSIKTFTFPSVKIRCQNLRSFDIYFILFIKPPGCWWEWLFLLYMFTVCWLGSHMVVSLTNIWLSISYIKLWFVGPDPLRSFHSRIGRFGDFAVDFFRTCQTPQGGSTVVGVESLVNLKHCFWMAEVQLLV